MASSEQSLSLRPKDSEDSQIPHPLPSLTEHELGHRLTITNELLTEMQTVYPDFIMRVEQAALILIVNRGLDTYSPGNPIAECLPIWQAL